MTTSWLIAIDGSEPALKAVQHVMAQTLLLKAPVQLYLVNVQPSLSSDITRFIEEKVVDDFHRESANSALSLARSTLDAAGLSYSAHVLVGEAAPALVDFAKDKGCSMIVMGAHGFGSVLGLLMGSVTVKVVHLSPVPVLLIK